MKRELPKPETEIFYPDGLCRVLLCYDGTIYPSPSIIERLPVLYAGTWEECKAYCTLNDVARESLQGHLKHFEEGRVRTQLQALLDKCTATEKTE